jgi:2,4-dienoyl-CoA reductase-like NADH-dependent reductase (Old Yellow Enzyme family)
MQLFSPFECRAMRLRNRVAMAPMTRECAPGGRPTAEMAAYYARRAAGGTALIVTEGVAPSAAGAFGEAVPRLYGEDAVDAWRAVVDAVHAEGAAILAQVWHVGAFEPSSVGMTDSLAGVVRLSPSGLAAPDRPLGRAMTEAEIARTIEEFASAAAAARRAGFDGVEIHGAHGYLPDQFLWSGTNRRTDRWGGDLRGRLRFGVELTRAVRAALGDSGVLSYRLSQWKQLDYAARVADTPAQLAEIVEPLAAAGVDLFHCSTRRYWEPAFEGSDLGLAGWVRRLSGRPTIAVGSVTLGNDFKSSGGKTAAAVSPEQVDGLERRIGVGEFDLVAIGRALLANPDWVRLVAAGDAARLRPFSRAHLDVLA